MNSTPVNTTTDSIHELECLWQVQNKDRNRFEFGTSERMSLKEAAAKVQEQIAAVDILVTHGGAQDAELLECCGISVTEKIMFDTQLLAMVYYKIDDWTSII